MNDKLPGKLVVFEGGDGSGKGTQSQLLIRYLQSNNIPHSFLDFPQYDTFYGKIVAQFLRGEFGNLDEVSPYLAALTFALDRYAVKDTIIQELQEGKIVVANRYVTSNIAHQGSKFDQIEEQKKFIDWVEQLEYDYHGLPREDIVVYLRVPAEITAELTKKKGERSYLGDNKDIQEENHEYRTVTQDMYTTLAERSHHWIIIDCMEHGTIRNKEDIHKQIVAVLKERNIF